MASASSSKRQRVCDTAEFVDLSTQPADTGEEVAATQLESDGEEHDATPSDGSGQYLTIKERCDRIASMSTGTNTLVEDVPHEVIDDFDEGPDAVGSQVFTTPPGLDEVIMPSGSEQDYTQEAHASATSDKIQAPAVFRNSWLLDDTSRRSLGNPALLRSVIQPHGGANETEDLADAASNDDVNDDEPIDLSSGSCASASASQHSVAHGASDQEHHGEASVLTLSSSDAASPSQRCIAQYSHGVEEDGESEDARYPDSVLECFERSPDSVVEFFKADDSELVNPHAGEQNTVGLTADDQADNPVRDDTDEPDNDNEYHGWLCEVRSGGTQQ